MKALGQALATARRDQKSAILARIESNQNFGDVKTVSEIMIEQIQSRSSK